MDETEELRAARAMRRADARRRLRRRRRPPIRTPWCAEFQDYVTSMAWGVWTREGAAEPRATAACWCWR